MITPYYSRSGIDLYLGDCRLILPQLTEKVDLIVTSPPFNLGSNHHTGDIKHTPYPDDLPECEYQKQQIEVLDLLWNVTNESGSLLYQHKNRIKDGLQISPYRWLWRSQWIDKQEIVWVK